LSASSSSLDCFFAPASVAVVGASPDQEKIRGQLVPALRKNGYTGRLYPVNPSYNEVAGLGCFPSIAAIGSPVDLALVAIPAAGVPKALEDCAAAGARFAVVISSGFADGDSADRALQDEVAEIARRTGLRVAGPNSEGFHSEVARVTATFSPAMEPRAGEEPITATTRRIGVVAQSGGMAFALYNRGRALGLAFSEIVSTGNEADLTAADFFDHMVRDPATSIVILFLEAVRDPVRFIAAAERAAVTQKPVIVVKIGRSKAAMRAAASHTASMTGWGAAYDAAFKTHGMIVASDPDEALAIAAVLTTATLPRGNRVGIVTVSGGAGAWAADALAARGLEVPELSRELQATIAGFIPGYGSARNPVDITAQAVHSGGLMRAIELLVGCDEVDSVVVTVSLAREHRVSVDTELLGRLAADGSKPVLFFSYTLPSPLARRVLASGSTTIHTGLANLAAALRAAVERACFVPTPRPARRATTNSREIRRLIGGPDRTLTEHQSKAVLSAYGIAVPPGILVTELAALEPAAKALGFPLTLKIQSPDLPHKTEAGGVRLGLADQSAAHAAYRAIIDAVRSCRPDARIDGVLAQPMAPAGVEMIIGAVRDDVFGPIIMVGAGGTRTELYKDVTYRLAPVDANAARTMLRELRSAPLLSGYRGAPASDEAACAELIARISEFAVECRDIVREVEINPVVVHPAGKGITIVDALMIASPEGTG
jgi:acyl-CoA synthetase (NDP forming)